MTPGEISHIIRSEVLAAGFERCGITPAIELTEEKALMERWIAAGCHAGMKYLERNQEKRSNPALLFEGARTVVVATLNYYREREPEAEGEPVFSRYASGRDYHDFVKKRLRQALNASMERIPGLRGRVFADSAPLMEKALAVRAGVGCQGRNSLLIVPGRGSFHFIGEIVINMEASYDVPDETDPCGSCRKCIDACPSGAISEKGFVDASRCISYITVEHKGDIPSFLTGKMGGFVFGCDICQDVCPHNAFAPVHDVPEFMPDHRRLGMTAEKWEHLGYEEFKSMFSGTAVMRCGYESFMRNLGFLKKDTGPGRGRHRKMNTKKP
jgi:epoxyqueuosine reductase